MTPKRAKKFKEVAKRRQPNLTVILENVHDSHNIGAVLRSCDAVGIMEIFVLYTEQNSERLKLGKRTSAGTRKWVKTHLYNSIDACFEHVRSKYNRIYATHLDTDSKSLYDLELADSVALLFGNENKGVSKAVLEHVDGNFIIPQMGMAQSLNISVACAVTLYEAFRQRNERGYYDKNPLLTTTEQQILFDEYVERTKNRSFGKLIFEE